MNVTGERNDAMERSRRVVIAQDGPSLATTPNEDREVLGKSEQSPGRDQLVTHA
jgi:hypothetical protein